MLPVVLDRCAESCEAHQNAAAATPECHHATSTGMRISHAPIPCGHDHSGTAVAAAQNPAPTERAFDSTISAVDIQLGGAPPAAPGLRVWPQSPPDSPPTLDRRSLPLRV